jgi:hypothetical protein
MNSTIVMELLNALAPSEHKKVLLFLENPLHNQRQDVRLLANLLATTAPENYPQLDKRPVFQQIFGILNPLFHAILLWFFNLPFTF